MNDCQQLYYQFEQKVQECIRINKMFINYIELNNPQGLKKVVYVPLVQFMFDTPNFADCAGYILKHYNVKVFEQAWKVFGKMLHEGISPQNAMNDIAYQIVVRRLKDHFKGEISMFGLRQKRNSYAVSR